MTNKTKRLPKWDIVNQNQIGVHLIADFWKGKNIENSKELEKVLIWAVKKANGTPLEIVVHKFLPQGITGVILLAESHIALHSWPEYNYLAIDIFTCGDKAMPYQALDYLRKKFQPEKVEVKEIKRGIFNNSPSLQNHCKKQNGLQTSSFHRLRLPLIGLLKNFSLLNGRKKVKENLR